MSTQSIPLALRGPNGLAILGPSRYQQLGIRLADGEEGAAPAAPDAPEPPKPEPPAQEDKTDWKAEARKWESRAKENSDAATRLKEIEDAQKTEQERLTEQLAESEREKAQTAAELARLRAALEHKITDPAELKLLTGATPDELNEQAAAIIAIRGTAPMDTADPNGPKPISTIGQQPAPQRNVPLKDQIAAAEAAGDRGLVAALKAMQLGQAATN